MLQKLIPVVLARPDEKYMIHPLHAAVSVSSVVLHLGKQVENGSSFIGGLFVNTELPLANVFVTVHVASGEIAADDDNTVLKLYVTNVFLRHYGFVYEKTYYFRLVHRVPVERVVYGARSESSYLWAKGTGWHRSLLSAIGEQDILCRQGDVFLAAPEAFGLDEPSLFFDLVAIFSESVLQGMLTLSTTIIIVDIRDKILDHIPLQPYENFDLGLNDIDGHVKNSLSYADDARDDSCLSCRGKKKSMYFQLGVLSDLLFARLMPLEESGAVLDPFNTLFVSAKSASKLSAKTGDWVKIKEVYCEKNISNFRSSVLGLQESGMRHRLATLYVVLNDEHGLYNFVSERDDDVLFVTSHLWFNLNSHPSNLIQENCGLAVEMLDPDDDILPPYAKEVFLALVQSPCYSAAISCETVLKKYFKDTRFICQGDIICVDAKDAVDFYQRNKIGCTMGWPVVYFRVSVIEGPPSENGYLIDYYHTRLYQAGTAQSYIPVTAEACFSPCIETFYFNSPDPPGLSYYVDVLEEIMMPILNILNKKFQVSSNILLTGSTSCGKSVVVRAVCRRLNLHFYQVNCHEMLGDSSGSIEAKLKVIMDRAYMFAPCVTLLKNIDVIGKEMELKGENSRVLSSLSELLRSTSVQGRDWPCVIIATTTHQKQLSEDLSSAFLQVINMESPSEDERYSIIESLLQSDFVNPDVDFNYIAQRSAGFGLGDLCALVIEAKKMCHTRIMKSTPAAELKLEEDLSLAGLAITQQDMQLALEKLQSDFAKVTNAPKIPSVSWEDVGGLTAAKQEVMDTIQLPMNHPEVLSTGLRRSGILLYGPPGTGKTLIAKAVATECSMSFLSVKGPELLNMYVGQSEENVRNVFHQARNAAPCIIFFDELDSLAPNRGRSSDSTGVMDRVVSQLLAELDGLGKSVDIFVIGATNRPDLIDPALLRPGRFDRLVFVGIPEDKESRLSVLKALTRKMQLHPNVNFEDILEHCPPNLSGADFYSLCNDAMMSRAQKNVELIEKGDISVDTADCRVQNEDFVESVARLCPSVSQKQLSHYEQLRYAL